MGYFTEQVESTKTEVTVSRALCDVLRAAGVRQAFGIVGGGNAPFAEAILKSDMELIHTRHEAGAAFSATESSLVSGAPTAVFVTTGPGLFNALTGVVGARWDGAKVILVTGITSPALKGRWGVQETSSYTMPADGLFRAGTIFDYAVELEDVRELPEIARRLRLGCARPGGFVAHIAFPLALQTTLMSRPRALPSADLRLSGAGPALIEACAERLRDVHFSIWLGHGARHIAGPVKALAERTGAAVMCTPRAKGIFPEDHPQFVGVTGAGGHDNVLEYVRACRPRETLVLGTRLGEASSFWIDELAPVNGFIQVDLNPDAFGVSYPEAPVLAVQAEIGAFVEQLSEALPARARPTELRGLAPLVPLAAEAGRPVRPQFLMQTLQSRVIDNTGALVMSESGNSFAWANHYLRFLAPDRYRTSALYGSMGQVVAGAVGAAVGRKGKAVAIVGDGAMLMNNEISTAVQYRAQVVWVVLNDARYGITHQGMEAWGFTPVETELPPTDFVMMAASVGAAGVKVTSEEELAAALDEAMAHDGPFVVDVSIDRSDVSPVLKSRIDRLRAEGPKLEA